MEPWESFVPCRGEGRGLRLGTCFVAAGGVRRAFGRVSTYLDWTSTSIASCFFCTMYSSEELSGRVMSGLPGLPLPDSATRPRSFAALAPLIRMRLVLPSSSIREIGDTGSTAGSCVLLVVNFDIASGFGFPVIVAGGAGNCRIAVILFSDSELSFFGFSGDGTLGVSLDKSGVGFAELVDDPIEGEGLDASNMTELSVFGSISGVARPELGTARAVTAAGFGEV